ncbi:MAG: hypothetical protein ACMUIU_11715 [bacterium]
MDKTIKRSRLLLLYPNEQTSLFFILICTILSMIMFQGLYFPVNAGMVKTFTPRISIYEQYSDNIDLISNLELYKLDKNSDWLTMASPGFSLNLDSLKTKMRFDYETRITFYHKEKNKGKNNDFHYVTAQWEQQVNRNIKFDVKDTFSRSDDPILVSKEGVIEEVAERRIYYRNNGQISLSIRLSADSSIALGYINLYLDNKSVNYEDSIGHEFFFNLDTKINPYWKIGLESRTNRGKFKQPEGFTGWDPQDFYDQEGVITLSYLRHPSRSLFARYSLLAKKYDNPYITEFWLHQASVGLNLILSTNTNFSIEGGYFLQDFPNDRESENGARFNIALNTQKKKFAVNIGSSGGFTQDYFSSENLGSSKFNQVLGSVNYLISKDLSAFLSANYQWQDFLGENQGNRKDNVWRTSGGFYFSFSDWLTLSIEEAYSERRSESDLVFNRHPEFIRENRVMLRLTAGYSIRI